MSYLEFFASLIYRGHDRREAHIPFNQMPLLLILETMKSYGYIRQDLTLKISSLLCLAITTFTYNNT